jgi:hypothetical protein
VHLINKYINILVLHLKILPLKSGKITNNQAYT